MAYISYFNQDWHIDIEELDFWKIIYVLCTTIFYKCGSFLINFQRIN